MKRIAVICCIGILVAYSSIAQEPTDATVDAELDELCRAVLCREVVSIRLKRPNEQDFEVSLPRPLPIIAGDLITVYPGETVFVEARVQAARLVELTAVPTMRESDRTIVFHLKQASEIGDGTGMILTVTSPFNGVLKYRLGMMLPSGDDLLKTSSCPLHSGRPVFEHWPHPIFQIVATDFQFVEPDSSEASTCE